MKPSEELRKLQDKIHVYIEPIIASTVAQEQELVNLKRSNELHKSIAISEGEQADEDYAALQEELAALKEPMEFEGNEYEQTNQQVIRNLAMLVRRLAHKHPNEKLRQQAHNYLLGEGLQGSVLRSETQHSADLREVAEMAVRRAMNRINHPSQVGKIADIVLCEFHEKKAKVNHDSKR